MTSPVPAGPARRWLVPLVPFLFSLALAVPLENRTVFWQDSGFFLTAVHEFTVLYPHGFVLYLALAKAFSTLAGWLFGFTLAVHLLSGVAAAGAAAFLAAAARELLERLEPGGRHAPAAVGAGCLAAAGYTFWHSALLAKPYALYFLILSILLYLLLRPPSPRLFLAIAGVAGLAWAAHPSAALLIPVLAAYAAARRRELGALGAGKLAALAGLGAIAAVGPSLLLPLLASRESVYHFSSPRTAADLWSYLRGEQFTAGAHAFGLDSGRLVQAGTFAWEEYLGAGLVLLAVGAWRLGRRDPRTLAGIGAWVLPVVAVAVLFRAEGQLDLWLVSAYLPLALLLAVGIGAHPKAGPAVAAAGILWMVAANAGDLSQRHYPYAETFARLLLKNVDPGAPVVLTFDDSIATVEYLQAVRGERREVPVVVRQRLGFPWYDRALAHSTAVRIPDWERSYRSLPGIPPDQLELHAFANENVGEGRPVFSETPPDPRFLRPGLKVVPAGMLWKIAIAAEARLEERYWDYPADELALAGDIRRPRGVVFRDLDPDRPVRPEPFEHRLLLRLLQARLALADARLEVSPEAALAQYDLVRRAFPAYDQDLRFRLQRGTALFLTGRGAQAEPVLRGLLIPELSARGRSRVHYLLGEIALGTRRVEEARRQFEAALRTGGADEALRRRLQERLRTP